MCISRGASVGEKPGIFDGLIDICLISASSGGYFGEIIDEPTQRSTLGKPFTRGSGSTLIRISMGNFLLTDYIDSQSRQILLNQSKHNMDDKCCRSHFNAKMPLFSVPSPQGKQRGGLQIPGRSARGSTHAKAWPFISKMELCSPPRK